MFKLMASSLLTTLCFSQISFAQTIIAKKQPESQLTVMGITIGKSTLNDVKEKFKSKDIYQEQSEKGSLFLLCFKASNGSTLAFESNETGGPNHTVTSIAINGSGQPYSMAKDCEITTLIKTKLVINGVSLGMSPDLIKMVTGKPSSQTPNEMFYQYEVEEKGETAPVKITSTLKVEFKASAVTAVTATK